MEEPKKKSLLDNLVGLAAIIASVAIPLAQIVIGYFDNQTARIQSQKVDDEKRRFEITKLFMDNYVGKKADIQIATIQIMKNLDPAFFISIESGLKEATHSDTVRASIRRATFEAANEIGEISPNATKNRKVQKVLSAQKYEQDGLVWVSKGDFDKAKKSFEQAQEVHPTYYNMDEFMEKYDRDFSSNMTREQRKKFKDFYKKGWTKVPTDSLNSSF
jgi:Spy/CpxP family protein refolding chaperone